MTNDKDTHQSVYSCLLNIIILLLSLCNTYTCLMQTVRIVIHFQYTLVINHWVSFLVTCSNQLIYLSHDIASGSDIISCNKIDKPLEVYIFSNVT